MATAPAPAKEEWLPKAEAAALLSVSTRQIERYAERGRVRMKLARLPGDRSDRNIYATEDLLRVKTEKESGTIELAGRNLPQLALESSPILAALASLKPQPPRIDRAWMSLQEASEYSGLSARHIATYIRRGTIFALGRGEKTWEILRASLDALGAKLDV